MKRKLLTTTAFLLALTVSAQASIFRSIKAESKGDEIRIEWKADGENTFQTFEIERRSNEVPTYRRIGSIVVRPEGGLYTYTDNGAFFKSDSDKEFTYRIRAISPDGTEQYSPTVTVSHRVVSSVKRSWGMIKELFR